MYAAMLTWVLRKEPKTYDGEKTASSTNVAVKTGYLNAENWNWMNVFHPVQISNQSGLGTLMYVLILWS
jgi:DUF438 domain-containing protein